MGSTAQEFYSAWDYDQNIYNSFSPIKYALSIIIGLLYTKFCIRYPNQLLISERLIVVVIISLVLFNLLAYCHISLYVLLVSDVVTLSFVTISIISMNEEITKYCSIIFPGKTIYAIGALGIVNIPLNILMNLVISRLLDYNQKEYILLANL